MTDRPDPEPSDPAVLEYRRPAVDPRANPDAARGLIWGLLIVIPFLSGAMAVRYGRRGVRAARERGAAGERAARAAIVLGAVNLALSTAALVVSPFALLAARARAQQVQCASNLRQVGLAMHMYAANNRGFLPPSFDPVAASGIVGPTIFRCPSCGNDSAKPPVTVGPTISSHYVFLHPLSRLSTFRTAGTTELAYEPLANHDGRGINVLYVDGHVEWHEGAGAAATLARLAPPPKTAPATAAAAPPAPAPAPVEIP